MKQLLIDGAKLQNREDLHTLAATALMLPAYYGRNLDALCDCLCEQAEPVLITVQNKAALKQNLGRYGRALLRMLADAAERNPNITLVIQAEMEAQ